MEENQTAQGNENAVNNPSTEAGENNEVVSKDVFQKRLSKISSQKNEAISEAESLKERLNELEAKDSARVEADRIKNGEYTSIINEQKQTIETLTAKVTKQDKFEQNLREGLMEQLPEEQKEFGEDLSTIKLQKFVENTVQSIPVNAGKTNSQRQGVNPTGEFGGYDSPQEWATKDPQGYKNARNPLNSNNGIKIAYE